MAINDEDIVKLGAKWVANGLLELKDGKPEPTLEGLLFLHVVFQGWQFFGLLALAAAKMNDAVGKAQTDSALDRIIRGYADGLATAPKEEPDGSGSGG